MKSGIQYIDRTTSHVNKFKLVTGEFSFREEINRHNVLGIENVILDIGDINISHGTQFLANGTFPVKRRVKHHGTGHFRDRADRLFRYTILMMRVDTTT